MAATQPRNDVRNGHCEETRMCQRSNLRNPRQYKTKYEYYPQSSVEKFFIPQDVPAAFLRVQAMNEQTKSLKPPVE